MIKDMLLYSKVADLRILTTLEKHPDLPQKVFQLMDHVLNAQHIWASRILGQLIQYDVWGNHPSDQRRPICEENFDLLLKISMSVDFETNIHYRNGKGEKFENTVYDILLHVINHGTYHRGQIASLIKSHGITPPVSDYILLKRQGDL